MIRVDFARILIKTTQHIKKEQFLTVKAGEKTFLISLKVEDNDIGEVLVNLRNMEIGGDSLDVEASFNGWQGSINMQIGDPGTSSNSQIERSPTNLITPTPKASNHRPPLPLYNSNTPHTENQNNLAFVPSPSSYQAHETRASPSQKSPIQELPSPSSNSPFQPSSLAVQYPPLAIQQSPTPSSPLTYQRKKIITPFISPTLTNSEASNMSSSSKRDDRAARRNSYKDKGIAGTPDYLKSGSKVIVKVHNDNICLATPFSIPRKHATGSWMDLVEDQKEKYGPEELQQLRECARRMDEIAKQTKRSGESSGP